MKWIIALDQGTTSCRAILFNKQGQTVANAQQEFEQFFPQPGWVEHDAAEIWQTQLKVFREVAEKVPADEIAAVGITNQRETVVIWDRKTGKPLHRAIVWQCRRTSEMCLKLKGTAMEKRIQEKTGLVVDPYFSATKLHWLLEHVPELRKKAEQGDALFGTMDSWLIWNLTEGKVHVTDYSNASRTMLFNIHELKWDQELLDYWQIPAAMLPEVRDSSEVYGKTRLLEAGKLQIPIAGAAGDQQAALFGQACYEPGMAKNTYGTGCFILANTGAKPIGSANGLLTTIAWSRQGKVEYALEGSVFTAGAVVQWLRDGLGIIEHAAETEPLAQQVEDTGGVYFVPAFTGLGTPHWKPEARGLIHGLTRGTTKAQLVRAALEAIAYQSFDVLQLMEEESGIQMKELRVDGGAAQNDFLMQFQADLLRQPVVRCKIHETTALGAAYLAGLAVGFWKDTEELKKFWSRDKTYQPAMEESKREEGVAAWRRAVNMQ